MKLKDYNIEDVKKILLNSSNIREFLTNINQSSSGNAYKRVKVFLDKNKLDYSHFEKSARWSSKEKTVEEVFVQNRYFTQSSLRNKVLKYNLLDYKCSCGNVGEWNGKELVLQLDHINGDNCDNRIENLRFLCPNCHSQTDTHSGKNNKKLL